MINKIKRINSRLETVKNSLGADSKLYNDYKNAVAQTIPFKFLKTNFNRFQIDNTKSVRALNNIDKRLDSILNFMNNHKLTDEKSKIRQFAKASGYTGKFTYAAYHNYAIKLREASDAYGAAIQFLYNYETTSTEAAEALKIARSKGKKSYADILTVLNAKSKIEKDTAAGNGPEAKPYIPQSWYRDYYKK